MSRGDDRRGARILPFPEGSARPGAGGRGGLRPTDDHVRLIEAILFASPEPVPDADLAARLPTGVRLDELLLGLQADYAGRGITLVRIGQASAFRTAEDLAGAFDETVKLARKPSRAALEVLAIIAWHQPVSRPEIEEVRGVATSKGTLDALLEAGWVRPRGRRRSPGRPLTFGTTTAFLDAFALGSLDDLPDLDDLRGAGLIGRAVGRRAIPADSTTLAPEDPLSAEEAAALAAGLGEDEDA